MILEGIVTTIGPDGAVNIAPMGPTVDAEMQRVVLRPFPTAQTYRNLCAHGEGVLHVTDDVDLLARAAIGPVEPPPPMKPASSVRGFVLTGACRFYEFRVRSINDKEQRMRIEADVVHAGRSRDFFGFNRAKHAVVEAAIMATRTRLLPAEEIEAEFRRLGVIVEKTGGDQEKEAFALLNRHVSGQRRRAGSWVRVQAPSRLHFGLLVLPAGGQPAAWPDLDGRETVPARHFGGAGLMVQAPGVQVAARPSREWSVTGPLAPRVQAVAEQVVQRLAGAGPCQIVVEPSAPEHCGLGTGTQISLVVARAVQEAYDLPPLSPCGLAKLVDRFRRSAIGMHGFGSGGFLVEAGRAHPGEPGQLIAREPFPADWAVLLVVPSGEEGKHGGEEQGFFAQLQQPSDLRQTEALCRLVLVGMLPALRERDLPAFGEALYDFNRRAGEMFRKVQGGMYGCARTQAIVEWLRGQQVHGVGQSSWGPAVFAVAEQDRVAWLKTGLPKRFVLEDNEIVCTSAANHGAKVSWEPPLAAELTPR
jgi:beta-RFAP synthase